MAVENTTALVSDEKSRVVGGLVAKGQRWVFLRKLDKKTDICAIEAQKFDKTGELHQQIYPMASFKDVKVSTFGEDHDRSSVRVLYSPDSTKVGLFINTNLGAKDKETFYVSVFNTKDMSKVWSQTVLSPYIESQYLWTKVCVNNAAQIVCNAYLLDLPIAMPTKTKLGYKYIIHTFDGKAPKGVETTVALEGKFPMSCFIKINPDNDNTIVSGFYADEYYRMSNGVYFMEIEKVTNKLVNSFVMPLPADQIKNVSKFIVLKKENALWYDAKIQDVFVKKNGEIVFVSTNIRDEPIDTRANIVQVKKTDCDIVVVTGSSKGELRWATALPKHNETTLLERVGTFTVFNNDNLFLFYNDNVKNATADQSKECEWLYNGINGGILMAKIDTKGPVERKVLITYKESNDFIITPNQCLLTGKQEAVILMNGGADVKIGKINILD